MVLRYARDEFLRKSNIFYEKQFLIVVPERLFILRVHQYPI